MSFVITGATGQLGRLVVESLLERGVAPADIVAGARDVARLDDLAARGIGASPIDYNDAGSISFGAGDVVLLVSGSEVGHASRSSRPSSTPPSATEWRASSTRVRRRLTRPRWCWRPSTGAGRVASATHADFAAAAAAVLVTDGHESATYELGGDAAWDFDELAAAFSEVLGRDVVRRDVTTDEHVSALLAAGLDEGTAGFVAALDANIREGALAEVTGDIAGLTGRPTTPRWRLAPRSMRP